MLNRMATVLRDLWDVLAAEVRRVFTDQTTIVIFFLATVVYPPLYYYIYHREVLQEMAVVVVDLSQSEASKRFVHKIDATPELRVAYRSPTLAEGERLVDQHKAKALFLFPADYADRLAHGETSTVTCFSDISSFLYYKNALLGGSSVMLDELENVEVVNASWSMDGNAGGAVVGPKTQPIGVDDVKLYNPSGGYASYFIPALLLLVIHQTLFFGICVLCGDANENRRALHFIPPRLRTRSIHRVTAGRLLCFLLIYVPISLFDLWIMPRIFGMPQLGSAVDIVLFLLPFIVATACFGMTFGNLFSRQRMSTLLCCLFFSVILFFLSGLVWPQCSMPRFWLTFSYLFPSTPGIQGFVRISSMGATLAQVRWEYLALWGQAAFYFITACLSLRFIKRFK